MKKFFEDELSLGDVKALAKGFKKKNNCWVIGLAILGVAAVAAVIALVVIKLKNRCGCDCDEFDDDYDDDDYDDDDDDDNVQEDDCGCRYAEEKDFEE